MSHIAQLTKLLIKDRAHFSHLFFVIKNVSNIRSLITRTEHHIILFLLITKLYFNSSQVSKFLIAKHHFNEQLLHYL